MKKLLFGTTALVGALALSSAATAQEISVGGALDLRIEGTVDFEVEYADEDFGFGFIENDPDTDDDDEDSDRSFFFNQDQEIRFLADGVGDATGIEYGANVQLELDTGSSGDGEGAQFDEAWMYFRGNWGEVRLGDEDGVNQILAIGGGIDLAGTGGLDGTQRSVGDPFLDDSGEATKVIYFTPEFAGFQAGVNYAINGDDRGSTAGPNDSTSDHIEAAANWQGEFSGVGLGFYAGVASFSDDSADDDEDVFNWAVGASVELYGITLAGTYADEDGVDDDDRDSFFNVSVASEFAGVGVSFGFQQDEFEDDDEFDEQRQYVVSADTGILPGVALRGDVAYVENFEGDDDADGVNAIVGLRVEF